MKHIRLFIALPFFAACAEEPAPEPDPVALEQPVAQMDSEPVAAGIGAPKPDEEKDEVGRIANSLQKVDVDRVDPALAEALIGR